MRTVDQLKRKKKKEKNKTGLTTLQPSSGVRRADSDSSAPAELCSYVINNGQKIVFAEHSDVILKVNFDFLNMKCHLFIFIITICPCIL